MRVLVLNHDDVVSMLTPESCIEVMSEALRSLDRGEVAQPLRSIMRAAGAPGLLGLMPAYRADGVAGYGLKAVCVYPDNPARGLDTHVGAVLIFDRENGALLCLANAAAITAIRTAAVSAVATRALARPGSEVLTIFGTGAQAHAHLRALQCVHAYREIRVVGRSLPSAERFASEYPSTRAMEAQAALRDADVVVTATSSREPIIRREWLQEGTHINAVGSSVRTTRELDGQTMRDASIFVDWRESTLNESGDFLMAQSEGLIGPENIRGTLGEVLNGAQGRRSDREITLFKSLGLGIEDHAAASFLFERCSREGTGSWIEL